MRISGGRSRCPASGQRATCKGLELHDERSSRWRLVAVGGDQLDGLVDQAWAPSKSVGAMPNVRRTAVPWSRLPGKRPVRRRRSSQQAGARHLTLTLRPGRGWSRVDDRTARRRRRRQHAHRPALPPRRAPAGPRPAPNGYRRYDVAALVRLVRVRRLTARGSRRRAPTPHPSRTADGPAAAARAGRRLTLRPHGLEALERRRRPAPRWRAAPTPPVPRRRRPARAPPGP